LTTSEKRRPGENYGEAPGPRRPGEKPSGKLLPCRGTGKIPSRFRNDMDKRRKGYGNRAVRLRRLKKHHRKRGGTRGGLGRELKKTAWKKSRLICRNPSTRAASPAIGNRVQKKKPTEEEHVRRRISRGMEAYSRLVHHRIWLGKATKGGKSKHGTLVGPCAAMPKTRGFEGVSGGASLCQVISGQS